MEIKMTGKETTVFLHVGEWQRIVAGIRGYFKTRAKHTFRQGDILYLVSVGPGDKRIGTTVDGHIDFKDKMAVSVIVLDTDGPHGSGSSKWQIVSVQDSGENAIEAPATSTSDNNLKIVN